ncbi:MAG: hypothetical protein M1822_004000 [Bathelium mastoideum]|nr:MAG: hypothetical protein M1822_004000 [Bathelium mastoideum]
MGNCFGKQSSSADDDNFAGAGRTIGAAPQPQGPDANARGTIPARISQGRTLGGGDAVDEEDPRTAAARAAEVGRPFLDLGWGCTKGGVLGRGLGVGKGRGNGEGGTGVTVLLVGIELHGNMCGELKAGEAGELERSSRAVVDERSKERASKAQGKGALGKKLDAQRQQTRTNTLEQASRENRLARDADAAAQTRNWD